MNGEGVQRGLRCIVGESLRVVDRRAGVAVQRQRTQNAGEVDDTCCGTFAQQGQQSLCQCDSGKQIRLKDLLQRFGRSGTGSIATPAAFFRDAGIVNQNVEFPKVPLDILDSCVAVFGVGNV